MKMSSDVYEITLYSPINNSIFVPNFLRIIKELSLIPLLRREGLIIIK